jgi:hypothetical protein
MTRMNTHKVARIFTITLSGVLAVALAAATAAPASGQAPGSWKTTGTMLPPQRHFHTATLLQNGRVLVTGGLCANGTWDCGTGSVLNSAELYNPSTSTWTRTGSMSTGRYLHTATLLKNGEVLVAGGFTSAGVADSAELYNPSTGRWTTTGSMTVGRAGHAATRLQNGEVLVAGGSIPTGRCSGGGDCILTAPTSTAELYDPSTGTFTKTGSMNDARTEAQLTLLQNGEALTAGGCSAFNDDAECDDQGGASCSAEVFSNGHWSLTTNLVQCATAVEGAVLLPNGDVLIVVGNMVSEFYDPSANDWQATLNQPNVSGQLALLATGNVLVAGGALVSGGSNAALYDPSTNEWTPTGSSPIGAVTLTQLLDGQVLATQRSRAALFTP